MMNLLIDNKKEELFLSIKKDNAIFLLNKKSLFDFYYLFYEVLKNKTKEVQIKIGEKFLDSKNTILLSLCDYTEILESLSFKKGSLFYEYLVSIINMSNYLDNDILFSDLSNVIKNLLEESEVKFQYDINEDLEKMIFSFAEFSLKYNYCELSNTLNVMLKSFMEKNVSKLFIVFYNSSLLELNFKNVDNCYTFDVSEEKSLEQYNLICENNIKELNLENIIQRLETVWPVEFDKKIVMHDVSKYFMMKKVHLAYDIYSENELLVCKILDKMREEESQIISHNVIIRDNVKSFLEHF